MSRANIFWFDITQHSDHDITLFGKSGNQTVGIHVAGIPQTIWFELDACISEAIVEEFKEQMKDAVFKSYGLANIVWTLKERNLCPHISYPIDSQTTEEARTIQLLGLSYTLLPGRNLNWNSGWVKKKVPLVKRIFQGGFTAVQRFLLHHDIKGMCWITFNNIKTQSSASQRTNCESNLYTNNCDITIPREEDVVDTCTLNITYISAWDNSGELSGYAALKTEWSPIQQKETDPNYHTLILSSDGSKESEILTSLATVFSKTDLLVGYQLHSSTLPFLLSRFNALGKHEWLRMTRLSSLNQRESLQWVDWRHNQHSFAGIVFCDAFKLFSSKDLFRRHKTYFLNELARDFLPSEFHYNSVTGVSRRERASADVKAMRALIMNDDLISLTKEISSQTGCIWADTFNLMMSTLNDNMLMQSFVQRGYVFHDYTKQGMSFKKSGQSDTLLGNVEGGRVLEIVPGLHRNVLTIDVEGTYPSLFQSKNVCFSTLKLHTLTNFNPATIDVKKLVKFQPNDSRLGVIPSQCSFLWHTRLILKAELKNLDDSGQGSSDAARVLRPRVKAMKLLANCIYGCLLSPMSKFYNRCMGMIITGYGRAVLTMAEQLVEQRFADIVTGIGGDTDSLLLKVMDNMESLDNQSREDELKRIAEEIKEAINAELHGVQFAVDGIYDLLYYLEKKRYLTVAFDKSNTMTFKGCDNLQGGVAQCLIQLRQQLLIQLITSGKEDFATISQKLKNSIKEWVQGLIQARPNDVNHYVITTKLKDPLHTYSLNNHHHHIQAAFVLKGMGREPVPNQRLRYVIMFEQLANDQTLSYPIEFLQATSSLGTDWKINYEYYARKHFVSELKRLAVNLLSISELDALLSPLYR